MMNRITPENISELSHDQVFCFGSNLSGIHGAGAARLAYDRFGARWYCGVGMAGRTYAIPTKGYNVIDTLSLDQIRLYVDEFILHAIANPGTTYLMTQIGCGLAGYNPIDIAPLFAAAVEVPNIHLPLLFWEQLAN